MTDEQASATSAEIPIQSLPENNNSGSTVETVTPSVIQPKSEAVKEVVTEKLKAERTFTRDELARATAAAQHNAYEKAKADLLKEQQQNSVTQQATPANQGSNNQVPVEQIRQTIEQMYVQNQMELTERQLVDKINEGKTKYPDWEETVVSMDLTPLVNVNTAPLFNQFDNAADIIYELAKNPGKIPQLAGTLSNPIWAGRVLKQMSDSIKANQEAVKQPVAKAPLSQEKPSTVGSDNGSMTVSDLRAQKWLHA